LGNLLDKEAHDFLYRLGANLMPGDKIFLGVDLIKSREIVLPAYSDETKITARFNLNLLHRINKELGGNFQVDNFEHIAEYTEKEGIAKSFLQSKLDQQVKISGLEKSFAFKSGERIHTEISRKYNDQILHSILEATDLEIISKFLDSKHYFANYLIRRN
jgi:uncharacterized SAM-dependent methyltransferase